MTPETEPQVGPDSTAADAETESATPPATEPDRGVSMALDELTKQIARFHERSERQERIVRAMQERIDALQGDQILALLKPALLRFAGLHAQALEAAERAHERSERAENDLAFFAVAVEEALGLLDLESVGAVAGATFDSSLHAAIEAVPTGDPSLDRTIADVARQGFTYSDAKRATFPAQVKVHRFDESLAPAGAPSADDAEADAEASQEQTLGAAGIDDTEEH